MIDELLKREVMRDSVEKCAMQCAALWRWLVSRRHMLLAEMPDADLVQLELLRVER